MAANIESHNLSTEGSSPLLQPPAFTGKRGAIYTSQLRILAEVDIDGYTDRWTAKKRLELAAVLGMISVMDNDLVKKLADKYDYATDEGRWRISIELGPPTFAAHNGLDVEKWHSIARNNYFLRTFLVNLSIFWPKEICEEVKRELLDGPAPGPSDIPRCDSQDSNEDPPPPRALLEIQHSLQMALRASSAAEVLELIFAGDAEGGADADVEEEPDKPRSRFDLGCLAPDFAEFLLQTAISLVFPSVRRHSLGRNTV
ncbi:hypothetical protein F5Y17DRAFT_457909 [Xylariaceae sp. FL0594]|nr:hypothetical protein F5Y17DRAFT_457909 [Xylariaceae sp. FL0594]